MRAMNIRVVTGSSGLKQLRASFTKNWKLYLMEALGLAIFMASACFFGALLESPASSVHSAIPAPFTRMVLMGVLMSLTALFIFYCPLTAPSGSHINPAVTVSFFRMGKMCHWDALFYIICQCIGGALAVYIMAGLLGGRLKQPPVNYVCTVPGKTGVAAAALAEFFTAFIMMAMVLFTSENNTLKKYTRVFAACLVCLYVIFAGPVSGFGMNPARSLASAINANNYEAFWIYVFIPFGGMLAAAEFFIFTRKRFIS